MAEAVQVANRARKAGDDVEQPASGAIRQADRWFHSWCYWKDVCCQRKFVARRWARIVMFALTLMSIAENQCTRSPNF